VIAFILLSGAPPFVGNTDSELFTSIKAGQWQFDHNLLNSVSADAKDFIKQCLNKRVSKRFSAAEALKHKWFLLLKSGTHEEGAPSPVLLQRFSTFVVRTWLAKIFIDVLSHTLHSTDITELRDQFQRFDISGTGVISKEELRAIVKTHVGSENAEEFLNALVLNMDIDQTGTFYSFYAMCTLASSYDCLAMFTNACDFKPCLLVYSNKYCFNFWQAKFPTMSFWLRRLTGNTSRTRICTLPSRLSATTENASPVRIFKTYWGQSQHTTWMLLCKK